jgi:rhomboid protease GluP
MAYLHHVKRFTRDARLPWISILLCTVTAVVSAMQFRFPPLLAALRRDLEGLQAGEVWRLVTPLFVQPDGIGQVLSNGMFMVLFLPLAERLYGARLLFIYFTAGVLVQCLIYPWSPNGGGSSSALFGIMGALFGYVLRHRRVARSPFVVIASVAVVAAIALTTWFRADGHGPGLLIGVLLAAFVAAEPFPEGHATAVSGAASPVVDPELR